MFLAHDIPLRVRGVLDMNLRWRFIEMKFFIDSAAGAEWYRGQLLHPIRGGNFWMLLWLNGNPHERISLDFSLVRIFGKFEEESGSARTCREAIFESDNLRRQNDT